LTIDGGPVEGFCEYSNKCLNPVKGWYNCISDRLGDLPAF